MYYLMIKTHNITKLKYLCKTKQSNPFKYKGSGKYWTRHLKIHGDDISTEIIFQSEDIIEFSSKCLEYSKQFNVVESEEWANLIHETGLDGGTTHNNPYWLKGFKHSDETKAIISEANKKSKTGRKLSDEHKRSISDTLKGRPNDKLRGIPKTDEHRKNLSLARKGKKLKITDAGREIRSNTLRKTSSVKYKCSICGGIGNAGLIGRYHKKCMEKPEWKKIIINEPL